MNKGQSDNMKLKIHFKYTVVILLLVSCTIGGLALYNQNLAVKGLSNAALLLSIVLAIIAILITLWDVAGQKQNVYDMKKEIEKLNSIVNKSSSFSEELEKGLTKIESKYIENTKILNSLQELVIESKETDKPEEFYEKAQSIINKNLSVLDLNNLTNLKKSKEFKVVHREVVNFISKNPGINPKEIQQYFKSNSPKEYHFIYREVLNNIIFNKEVNVDETGGLTINF